MDIDYQVAVIGAGIVGASIAARLTSLGLTVALLEQGSVASLGASAWSGGLVRLYDADPLLMQLTAHSLQVMRSPVFATTYTQALRCTGVLYRAGVDQQADLQAAIDRHASAEYPMQWLQGHGLYARRDDRLDLFEPNACVGDVRQATARLCGVLRSQGLVLEHCQVQAIDWQADGSASIHLGQARLRCRVVVLASGAWTRRLLPALALESRSIPLARVLTERSWSLPVIDAPSASYAIPLSRHIVQSGCGLRDRAAWPQDLAPPDARHYHDALKRVTQLAGGGQAQVLDILPGFDSYSADGRPLLGFVDDQRGLYVACGLSGLGFKFAPGIADIAGRQVNRYLTTGDPGMASPWTALCARRALHATQPADLQQGNGHEQ